MGIIDTLKQASGDIAYWRDCAQKAQRELQSVERRLLTAEEETAFAQAQAKENAEARDAALLDASQARAERDEWRVQARSQSPLLDKWRETANRFRAERDVALAELSQAWAERDGLQRMYKCVYCTKVDAERDAAVKRAEKSEAAHRAAEEDVQTQIRRAEAAEASVEVHLKALQMANDDVRQLREENARLTEANSMGSEQVRQLQEERAENETLLSRAVAALQWADKALNRVVSVEQTYEFVKERECVTSILTDPTATAAVEAMRAEQERQGFQGHVCDDANCQWRGFTPQPGTYVERHLAETHPNARIVVDARRGGR